MNHRPNTGAGGRRTEDLEVNREVVRASEKGERMQEDGNEDEGGGTSLVIQINILEQEVLL